MPTNLFKKDYQQLSATLAHFKGRATNTRATPPHAALHSLSFSLSVSVYDSPPFWQYVWKIFAHTRSRQRAKENKNKNKIFTLMAHANFNVKFMTHTHIYIKYTYTYMHICKIQHSISSDTHTNTQVERDHSGAKWLYLAVRQFNLSCL